MTETASGDNFSTQETTNSYIPYMAAGLMITLFCGLHFQSFSKIVSKEKNKMSGPYWRKNKLINLNKLNEVKQ
jgi:hypothetical protein